MFRIAGWVWLIAGTGAVLSLALAGLGFGTPSPHELAISLALPWSLVLTVQGLERTMMLILLGIGVFINANLLFAVGRMVKR